MTFSHLRALSIQRRTVSGTRENSGRSSGNWTRLATTMEINISLCRRSDRSIPCTRRRRFAYRDKQFVISSASRISGRSRVDFIWGTHRLFAFFPALSFTFRHDWGSSGKQPMLRWVHRDKDMSGRTRSPPEAGIAAGHYATELSGGWFGVENPTHGIGILFEFPV